MPRMKSTNVFQNRLIENGRDGLVTVGEEFECSDDMAKDYERLGYAERLSDPSSDALEARGEPLPDPATAVGTAGIVVVGTDPEPQPRPEVTPETAQATVDLAPEVAPAALPDQTDAAQHSKDGPVISEAEAQTAQQDAAAQQEAAKADKAPKAAAAPVNKKAVEPANKAAPDAAAKTAE